MGGFWPPNRFRLARLGKQSSCQHRTRPAYDAIAHTAGRRSEILRSYNSAITYYSVITCNDSGRLHRLTPVAQPPAFAAPCRMPAAWVPGSSQRRGSRAHAKIGVRLPNVCNPFPHMGPLCLSARVGRPGDKHIRPLGSAIALFTSRALPVGNRQAVAGSLPPGTPVFCVELYGAS